MMINTYAFDLQTLSTLKESRGQASSRWDKTQSLHRCVYSAPLQRMEHLVLHRWPSERAGTEDTVEAEREKDSYPTTGRGPSRHRGRG